MIKNEIDLFLEHHQALCQQTSPSLLDYLRYIYASVSAFKLATNWLTPTDIVFISHPFCVQFVCTMTRRQASNTPRQLNNELNQTLHEVDEDYELEIGNYNPVQTLFNDHGISLISLSSTSYNKIDHHLLQVITIYILTRYRALVIHVSSVFICFLFLWRFCITAPQQFSGSPIRKPDHHTCIFAWSDAAQSSRGNGPRGGASSLRWISTYPSIPRRMLCRAR